MTDQSFRILLQIRDNDDSRLIEQTIRRLLPHADLLQTGGDSAPNGNLDACQALFWGEEIAVAAFRERLRAMLEQHPELLLIPLIPRNSAAHVQAAVELPVFFYLTLPLDQHEIALAINRLNARLCHCPPRSRRKTAPHASNIPGFIGAGPAMTRLFELIHRVARDDYATVLIRGESGTGKELVAKAIHTRSRRRRHNFVPVNCAAIPDDLLESELFGHLKGSFTGAGQNKTGRIQYADQGTLFLDEIGDMKPALQAKLLRVLQEKEFEPVGSLKAIPVDTRIVAATHCDLETLVRQGDFREDLYYRLSVVPIEVPPLRDRAEDIPLLLERFITTYTVERGRERIAFAPETVSILMHHEWRGNVRELENLVQHMSILHSGRTIRPQDLPGKFHQQTTQPPTAPVVPPTPERSPLDITQERAELFAPLPPDEQPITFAHGPVDFNELINGFETELILTAMRYTDGNKKEAARLLCLKRTTLLEKIKKKGLEGNW